jgi:hypothetical protein
MRYSRFTVLFVSVLVALTCAVRAVERSIMLRGTVLDSSSGTSLPYALTCRYDSVNAPADTDDTDAAFYLFSVSPWLTHTFTVAEAPVTFSSDNVAATFSLLAGSSSAQDVFEYSVTQRYTIGDSFSVDWRISAAAAGIFTGGNTNLVNIGIIPVAGSIELSYTVGGKSANFLGQITSIDFSLPSVPVPPTPEPPPPVPQTPEALIEVLSEEIGVINAGSGIVSSLDAKLSNALAALENIKRKDNASATRMMLAFINAVEAQRGKELTDAQADHLISTAHDVIDLIA